MTINQVDPELSRKRSEAGRRGAQARWSNRASNRELPDPAKSWREGVKAWRAQLPENAIKFRVENATAAAADEAAELYIYDIISADDWWGGVSATMVTEAVMGITADTINVHLNSPGGDVFEAHAIYNVLLNHSAKINILVDGLAASCASYIAQAGDTIVMASNASMMIHDAISMTYGNEADHAAKGDLLGKQSNIIAKIYADRAGGTAAEWRDLMRVEAWYDADEAVAAGLATSVADSKRDAASNGADVKLYGEAALHTLPPASTPAGTAPRASAGGSLDDIDVSELTKALEGAFA